jgi:ParB/RepB/Spo0J family partition protein
MKEIEIDKIKQLENIRLRISEEDVHTLMASIKQDGLLEPIGVSTTKGTKDEYIIVYGNRRLEACRKLGWKTIPAIIDNSIVLKDFVIKNTLENVEREQISESELGRIFYMLKNDYKMTNSELASRFGMSATRVKRTIDIFCHVPKEYRTKVKFNILGQKRGNISAKSADMVIGLRRRYGLNNEKVKMLLEVSRQDGFSCHHLEVVAALLTRNYTVDEAIALAKEYTIASVKLPILKKELDSLKKKHKMTTVQLVSKILNGHLKENINIPNWKINT